MKISHAEKYREVMDEVIRKSFPLLKGKKLFFNVCKLQLDSAIASVTYFGFGFWIVLFPLSKKFSDNMLKGVFAHELSHAELIIKMNLLEKLKFAFRWLFTKKGKSKFETDTDKNAIQKGYAKNLFNTVRLIEKIRTKNQLKLRVKQGYLSSEQIKSYAKKIGRL